MERPSPNTPTYPAVPVVPVIRAGRRPAGVIVVSALFVLAALVKPWGSADGSGPALADAGTTPVRGGQTSAPPASVRAAATPMAPDRGPCGGGAEWLLLAHETVIGREVVALLAVDQVPATGPLDPSIPFTRLVSPAVTALGFCAPAGRTATGASLRAVAWSAGRGRPARIIAAGWPEGAAMPYPGAAGAVVPSPRPASSAGVVTPVMSPGPASWPAGRYVLQLTRGGGGATWLGLEIASPGP
jgi:hypothetical protein